MKLLYIDTTNSGISGDMFLASLLGLVPDPEIILKELKELKGYLPNVSKLELELTNIDRLGIKIKKLEVNIKENKHHRSAKVLINSLNQFLNDKNFSKTAKEYSNKVLNSLIQAEAEVHGELIEKIHLHELSSVDTLIDIIGVTKALEVLNYFETGFKIYCSKLPLGGGTVKTAHGLLPVPAPATSKILEKSNLIVYNGPIEYELVTPTGAALLSNLKPEIKPYEMNLKKLVYSTGQLKINNFSNILRLFFGEFNEIDNFNKEHILQKYLEPITLLETNVDDAPGEIIGNFMKIMEQEKILDVQIVPSLTKKNRPSHIIKVLCRSEHKFELIEKILDELGTLGVRISTINRVCVERKIETKEIDINGKKYEIRFKVSFIESEVGKKIVNIKPEYRDLKIISKKSSLSIKEIQIFVYSYIRQIYDEINSIK